MDFNKYIKRLQFVDITGDIDIAFSEYLYEIEDAVIENDITYFRYYTNIITDSEIDLLPCKFIKGVGWKTKYLQDHNLLKIARCIDIIIINKCCKIYINYQQHEIKEEDLPMVIPLFLCPFSDIQLNSDSYFEFISIILFQRIQNNKMLFETKIKINNNLYCENGLLMLNQN